MATAAPHQEAARRGRKFRLTMQQTSMQFSDTTPQKQRDANVIFGKGDLVVSGTEAGAGSGGLAKILAKVARRKGYEFFMQPSQDTWIAIHESIIDGPAHLHYEKIIDGKAGKYTDKGVHAVTFYNKDIDAKFTLMSAHLNTRGRPNDPNPAWRVNVADNRRLNRANGEFARKAGKGRNLVFLSGDMNIDDAKDDVFTGSGPFVTCWDELRRWPTTGAGQTLDVLARSRRDTRVHIVGARAFSDSRVPLNTDHYMVRGVYDIDL